MIKESEDGLRRRIFDGEGFKGESRRGYFIGRITNIFRWWEITKERFRFSDVYFSLKGRL